MKIQDSTGPKANIVRVPAVFNASDNTLIFKVSAKELVDLAKDSKTGKSEGLMVSLTGGFPYEIDGQKVYVSLSQGQGGMGAWTSLKAAKVL
jgi:hypothetical protein